MSIKLEVGKVYKNRKDREVRIVGYIEGALTPFKGDDGLTYSSLGFFRVEGKDDLDLIEEIKTETEEKKVDTIAPEEYLKQFKQITDKMYEITKAKNSDYTADSGDAFTNFKVVEDLNICSVETGFLTRMSDKIARLAGLAKGKEIQVKDEKYEDTLLDLANYSILLAIYLKNKSL